MLEKCRIAQIPRIPRVCGTIRQTLLSFQTSWDSWDCWARAWIVSFVRWSLWRTCLCPLLFVALCILGMLFKSHKNENIFMGNCHVTIVLHDIFHVAYSWKVRFRIFRVILVDPGRWAYISPVSHAEKLQEVMLREKQCLPQTGIGRVHPLHEEILTCNNQDLSQASSKSAWDDWKRVPILGKLWQTRLLHWLPLDHVSTRQCGNRQGRACHLVWITSSWSGKECSAFVPVLLRPLPDLCLVALLMHLHSPARFAERLEMPPPGRTLRMDSLVHQPNATSLRPALPSLRSEFLRETSSPPGLSNQIMQEDASQLGKMQQERKQLQNNVSGWLLPSDWLVLLLQKPQWQTASLRRK